MQVTQPRRRFDRRKIKETAVGGRVFIRLLQDQCIQRSGADILCQHLRNAGRVNATIFATTAVDVPACAGKGRLGLCHGWAFDCPSS